jgi:hypothetical protein
MTRSDLLDLIYRFYPRNFYVDSPGHHDTEEHRRLVDATRRAVAQYPTWKAMIRRLGARFPLMDESLHVLSGSLAPAYSGHIDIPGRRKLGFHVCFLGPYYGVHRTGSPGEEPAARDLAREIEATYPGYEPIPPEIGNELVPDVALDVRNFGEATIYDCLLSTNWPRSSGPLP